MEDKFFNLKTAFKGHTLIELLIVLFVVSILASIAVPAFQRYAVSGRIDELKANVLKVSTIQENYFASNGRYASSIIELNSFDSIDISSDFIFNTGMVMRSGVGMSYWVSGRKDIGRGSGTSLECWVFFGSALDPGTDDNFVRYQDQVTDTQLSGNCEQLFCPTFNAACN